MRREIMPGRFVFALLATLVLGGVALSIVPIQAAPCCGESALATCTGAGVCNACKNCRYCKHCNEGGGKCGTCRAKK